MSRSGIIVAKQFGADLPCFPNAEAAELELHALKRRCLTELASIADLAPKLDYSPESLKSLELWFYEKGEPKSISSKTSSAQAFGFYIGEIYCQNARFEWIVKEFAFLKGHYEMGVSRPGMSIMFTKGKLPASTGNKLKQSLFREYKKYAGTASAV